MSHNLVSHLWVAPIAKNFIHFFPARRLPLLAEQPTRCRPFAHTVVTFNDNAFSQQYFAGESFSFPSPLAQRLAAIAAIVFFLGVGVSLVVFASYSLSPPRPPDNSGDPPHSPNSTVEPPPPRPPPSSSEAISTPKHRHLILFLHVALLAVLAYTAARVISPRYWRLLQSKERITIGGLPIPTAEDFVTRLLAVGLYPWTGNPNEGATETESEVTTPASPRLPPIVNVQVAVESIENSDVEDVELIAGRSVICLGERGVQIREPAIWVSLLLAARLWTDDEEVLLAVGVVAWDNVVFLFVYKNILDARIGGGGFIVEEDEVESGVVEDLTGWTILEAAIQFISQPRRLHSMTTAVPPRDQMLLLHSLCSSAPHLLPARAPVRQFSIRVNIPSSIPILQAHLTSRREVNLLEKVVEEVKDEATVVSHSKALRRLTLDDVKRTATPGTPIGNMVLYLRPGKKGLRKEKKKKGKGSLVRATRKPSQNNTQVVSMLSPPPATVFWYSPPFGLLPDWQHPSAPLYCWTYSTITRGVSVLQIFHFGSTVIISQLCEQHTLELDVGSVIEGLCDEVVDTGEECEKDKGDLVVDIRPTPRLNPNATVFVPRTPTPPSPPAFWQAPTESSAIEIRPPKKRKNRPHPNRSSRGAAARARQSALPSIETKT